jgi:hypothetical protein
MERVIEDVVALILHLRGESLNSRTRCFYCGREHRTIECNSPERQHFFMKLATFGGDSQAEEDTLREGGSWEDSGRNVASDDDDFLRETFTAFLESELE